MFYYIQLDQLNSTSQGLPVLLTMAAQLSEDELLDDELSEEEQSDEEVSEEEQQDYIVSVLVTNPVYYMC